MRLLEAGVERELVRAVRQQEPLRARSLERRDRLVSRKMPARLTVSSPRSSVASHRKRSTPSASSANRSLGPESPEYASVRVVFETRNPYVCTV